jgi:SAM-dependent methyltransferase
MTNRVNFDDYTKNYNALLSEKTSFFSPSEAYFAQYKVELIRQKIKSPVHRLLEYGCGIGRNIPFLKAAFPGAKVIGSDVSAASLEMARQDHPDVEFIQEQGQMDTLGLFDLICVAGVFHHVPLDQRDQVAGELFKRLMPTGELFVFEHNPYNPVTRRIVSNCVYDADAILISARQLKHLLADAGFKNRRVQNCLFIPPGWKSLLWLEPKLWWLPLGGQYVVSATK